MYKTLWAKIDLKKTLKININIFKKYATGHNGLKFEMKQGCQVDFVTSRTKCGFFHKNNLTAIDFEHPLAANLYTR